MKSILIKIGVDFSHRTGLRHCSISDFSGELFYHKVLNQAFKDALDNNVKLEVDIDGGRGYSPSFIDEAFGNLVYDFSLSHVKAILEIKTEKFKMWQTYILEQTFPAWEKRRVHGDSPTKTEIHEPWWRLVKNCIVKVNQ